MPNATMRHILAPTYGDENRLGIYVLVEVYPNVAAIVLDAQRRAVDFNSSPLLEGYFRDSQVVTPELGGEFVFTSLPEELEDWIAEQETDDIELPRLLPVELDPVLEVIKERHRDDGDLRWDSRPCRYIADKDDIRLQAADKHTSDYYVWTQNLWPFFSALEVDFDVLGFAVGFSPGGES